MERRQREPLERNPVEGTTEEHPETNGQPKAENAEYLAPGVYIEETSFKAEIFNNRELLDVFDDGGSDGTAQASLHGYGTVSGLGLSDVSSSTGYIGETEKNLSQELEGSVPSGTASFDEADALFGKRTEVRDAHDKYANQEVSYAEQEGTQVFRPELGDEVVVGNTEATKLVEALGSEVVVHQQDGSGDTPQINEEVELVGREGVAGFATPAPEGTPWSTQSVSADSSETGFVAVDKDNFNQLDQREIISKDDPIEFSTTPEAHAGFVEVPGDAAQTLKSDLAGNDIEWRSTQEQLAPEPQGFIVHELEKRGEAESNLVDGEINWLKQPDAQQLGGDEVNWAHAGPASDEGPSSAYLDVWERPVTSHQVQPAGLLDAARYDLEAEEAGYTETQGQKGPQLLVEHGATGTPAIDDPQVTGVWKAPAGTSVDIAGVKASEEPLEFKSISGMDSEAEVEEISMDETPRLFDEADASNVMVGMGQKDAFMEQTNPLSEAQASELLLPAVQLTDEPPSGDLESMSVDDDADPFDVG